MVTTKLGSDCCGKSVVPKQKEPSPAEIVAREIPPEKIGDFMITYFECTECHMPCQVVPLDGEYAEEPKK